MDSAIVIDPRVVASAASAAVFLILGAMVVWRKDQLTARGQDPVPIGGLEFDFDLSYQGDIDAGERQKFRLAADLLQPIIMACAFALAVTSLVTVVPIFALWGIATGVVIVIGTAIVASLKYRTAAAFIDASTAYGIFYQKAKYLGVRAIREKFAQEFPQYANLLKPGWDQDTTYYPDLQGGPQTP